MARVTVVGLGPAGPEYLTQQALTALATGSPAWLRTKQHPAATAVPWAKSFDDIYDKADSFADVYKTIVETLVSEALKSEHVIYAVPGSPLVAESTVEALRADERVEVEILPAMSFTDLAWAHLGVDPVEAGVRMIDGHRFVTEAASERGPLLVAQCDTRWVLSEIKLAFEDHPPSNVVVLQRLGMPDEAIFEIEWQDLDREVEPDIFTTLWIPVAGQPVAMEVVRLDEVTRRLRRDCPWDAEQTHESLTRYAIEETYELIEAIENLDDDSPESEEHLIEELGDVLIQVFVHAAIAAEDGRFSVADIAAGAAQKLVDRHPHVYGDAQADTAEDVASNWEASKMKAKGRDSIMGGIPVQLPALLRATKVVERAARMGVGVDEQGSPMLDLVANAVTAGEDPEAELRSAVDGFVARFRSAEAAAAADGVDLTAAAPDLVRKYWSAAPPA